MNVADKNSFDIADFAPGGLLGEGVWGRVYDLGDGTVLKIAREQCAGIGSGRAKIENECEALTLLAAAGALAGLVPVVRGRGDIPSSSPLAEEGFAVWLRMTKVSGRIISADDIDRLSRYEQSRIGSDLGITLACVHAGLRHALAVAHRSLPALGAVEIYADVANAAARLGDPFYVEAVAQLTKARRWIPSEVLGHPIHGDFNSSNILVAEDGRIGGILDFAEWGAGFPEKDFAHMLQELLALSDDVIASYERESGFATDPLRLTLAVAENALFGAVIAERQHDMDSAKSCRRALTAELKKLPG
jgi:aminoglycoside phosphotransferase (APT) family kinase protein